MIVALTGVAAWLLIGAAVYAVLLWSKGVDFTQWLKIPFTMDGNHVTSAIAIVFALAVWPIVLCFIAFLFIIIPREK